MRNSNYIRHFTFAILCAAFCLTACGESGPECCDSTATDARGLADCEAIPTPPACQSNCEDTGTCGDSGGASGTGTGSVSTEFAGIWTGSADFATARRDGFGNPLGYSYTAIFDSSVSGGQLMVSKFGINADGSLTAYGSGSSVAWNGSTVVNVSNGACPTGTVEYTSGTLSVSNGIYTMKLTGVEHWCGVDSAASLTISRATFSGVIATSGAFDY